MISVADVRWIAVRCCCMPAKVLGFMRLPCDLIRDGQQFMARHRSVELVSEGELRRAHVLLSIRCFSDGRGNGRRAELAIPSDERPIDWWRAVSGFVEVGLMASTGEDELPRGI